MDGREALLDVLAQAKAVGFLGPGDPADHLAHALGFADAALSFLPAPPLRFADLGTGGGVPGLVLASMWDDTEAVFIESSARRCQALEEWAGELGLAERVQVVSGRAEERAHEVGLRETFDLVTARSFGRPAVTAEIACGFLKVGALLVVSEPPEPTDTRCSSCGAPITPGPARTGPPTPVSPGQSGARPNVRGGDETSAGGYVPRGTCRAAA